MSGDQTFSVAMAVGMLLLVGSGLAARRLPPRTILMMAGAWIAIFAVGCLLVSLLHDRI